MYTAILIHSLSIIIIILKKLLVQSRVHSPESRVQLLQFPGYFGSVAVVQFYSYAKFRKYEPLEIRATAWQLTRRF